ncbi:MAG TPA: glycosyltransferase family 2 protein [Candidatus Pacebacteria bacterium]|nr:glycosyltransferase family 2 protein [Candidatus Paceibacterota bacterium]
MDLISIVIVNYNTPQDIRGCLDSLFQVKTSDFKFNVIVVDNGSKKSLQLSSKYLDHGVHLLRSESNLGFTGGNNLGISHAIKAYQSDYVLLLNSDTVVAPDFLSFLYHQLKTNPKAGLAAPKIYFYQGFEFFNKSYPSTDKHRVIWYAGGSVDWVNLASFHRGVDEVDRGQFDQLTESDFATGCGVLIRRELIERVGILDKRFFLYSEDVDYSLRIKRAGFSVLFVPESVIWHKVGRSSGGAGSRLQQYYQTRNRILLTFKHGPLVAKITAARLMIQWLLSGNMTERQAVLDFIFGRFGKQTIV